MCFRISWQIDRSSSHLSCAHYFKCTCYASNHITVKDTDYGTVSVEGCNRMSYTGNSFFCTQLVATKTVLSTTQTFNGFKAYLKLKHKRFMLSATWQSYCHKVCPQLQHCHALFMKINFQLPEASGRLSQQITWCCVPS